VFPQNLLAVRLALYELHRLKSADQVFSGIAEAANAAEQVK
jgi:hypothetical protein